MLLRLLHLAHLFAPAHPHVEFNRRVMRELDVCAAAAVTGTASPRWAESSQSINQRTPKSHKSADMLTTTQIPMILVQYPRYCTMFHETF